MPRDVKLHITNHKIPSREIPRSTKYRVLADARSAANSDLDGAFGSKRKGVVQVVFTEEPSKQFFLAIATGSDPLDIWKYNGSEKICTPAYTGYYPDDFKENRDRKIDLNGTKTPIASSCFSTVTMSDLANAQHVINRKEYSGKRLGTVVLVTFSDIIQCAFATGDEGTSPWYLTSGDLLFPINKEEDFDYQKVYPPTAQVSVGFDIFPRDQLIYSDQSDFWAVASQSPDGSIVIAYVTILNQPALLLMQLGISYEGEYVWYDLAGVVLNEIRTGYFPT